MEVLGAPLDTSALRRGFRGDVVLPGSPRYDRCRALFNGLIDRRPAAIVRPRSGDDVRTALEFGLASGLSIAVRGGGHNVAGHALVDDGLVIDFAHLRAVRVDPVRRRAVVAPGVTWREFDRAAQRHGLATTGGIVSDTGVAGLTLGGGLGWLMGRHGLSCDNLVRASVMLADGSTVEASPAVNPDLYWALRGGGGNFGIVLEFEFALHPVPAVYAGSVTYPVERARTAIERLRLVGDAAPDEVTLSMYAGTAADGSKFVSVDACCLGDEAAGAELTRDMISRQADIVSDTRRLRPYTEWQRAFDDPHRRGLRSYWKSIYVDELSAEFADLLAETLRQAPSPHTILTFDHVHGAAARVGPEETAFSHRDKRYLLLVNTNWDGPADDELNIEWTRSVFQQVSRFGTESGYVNYLGQEGAERVQSAYSPANLRRLARVKGRYDPYNVFRANQNIPPDS